MPSSSPSVPDKRVDRAEGARRVALEWLRRRASGEEFSDASVIAARAELMPELGRELRKARLIEAAAEEALRSGPAPRGDVS